MLKSSSQSKETVDENSRATLHTLSSHSHGEHTSLQPLLLYLSMHAMRSAFDFAFAFAFVHCKINQLAVTPHTRDTRKPHLLCLVCLLRQGAGREALKQLFCVRAV